ETGRLFLVCSLSEGQVSPSEECSSCSSWQLECSPSEGTACLARTPRCVSLCVALTLELSGSARWKLAAAR
ncbi:hypothetical protein A2U01_0070763, partial [Trifolium medium]|nr:hypothetical protein [Trifolium medium]